MVGVLNGCRENHLQRHHRNDENARWARSDLAVVKLGVFGVNCCSGATDPVAASRCIGQTRRPGPFPKSVQGHLSTLPLSIGLYVGPQCAQALARNHLFLGTARILAVSLLTV